MGRTRQHESTSDQFTVCDAITGLAANDFKLPNDDPFCIDNENESAVILEVKFYGMDAFVSKKIYPGPNVFLLKAVKKNMLLSAPELANLKYGY